ncbi:MAG: hypothetical protein GY833_21545 [Aestuariibacter sp.]|nr:hypothetical protein [Aestuariibacter sp.]
MRGWLKLCRNGATRTVLLVGNYAVKVPRLGNPETFYRGLLANLTEKKFGTCGFAELATVVYGNVFGLVLVMKRVRPVRHRGLYFLELERMRVESGLADEFILSDAKPENFGYNSQNRLVKCDFGN